MQTPWGKADYRASVVPGVVVVSTPSHGGVMVDFRIAEKQLSSAALGIAEAWGTWYAFEEDCAWSAVGREHPEWLVGIFNGTAEEIKQQAEECYQRWYGQKEQANG